MLILEFFRAFSSVFRTSMINLKSRAIADVISIEKKMSPRDRLLHNFRALQSGDWRIL